MKLIIILFVLVCLIACSKKTQKTISQDQRVNELRFESDSVPQSIKNQLKIIKCSSVECDKLLVCYGQYFKFLYGNMDIPLKIDLLECALKVAESNNSNGQNLILDYYGSKYKPKDGGVPDWAKRLRGEDAFEITLEYMRQSKGLNVGVGMNKAYSIFDSTLSPMLEVKSETSIYNFYRTQKLKYATNKVGMEIENWITTDFIDILKKEIKEGRVVFKKYGE